MQVKWARIAGASVLLFLVLESFAFTSVSPSSAYAANHEQAIGYYAVPVVMFIAAIVLVATAFKPKAVK